MVIERIIHFGQADYNDAGPNYLNPCLFDLSYATECYDDCVAPSHKRSICFYFLF
jgi:hypothetical protein